MKRFLTTIFILGTLVVLPSACSRRQEQAPQEPQAFEYPTPRYPKYLVKFEPERLLRAARIAVRQQGGMTPLGKVQKGELVHIWVNLGQDMEVAEAIKQAWAELGVKAEVLGYWDVMEISKEEYLKRYESGMVRGNEAWKELGNFEQKYRVFFPEDIREQFGNSMGDFVFFPYAAAYLDKHPEVTKFYAGPGGGKTFWGRGVGPKHADKFMGNWIYVRVNDLISKAVEFPSDVWNLVDETIVRPVSFVSEVHLTDPEGTHLEWTLTPEQANKWREDSGGANHLYVYPSAVYSTLKEGAVIRAHGNHTGVFPTMSVYLNKYGVAERVEGGDRVGQLFSMLLNHPKLKNVKFPKAPAPGYWYLRQDGLATNPKYVRNLQAYIKGDAWMANLTERQRAGVQHLAFSYESREPEDLALAQKEGIPLGQNEHTNHMHLYFPTFRWKLRDTGEWVTIVEKGNLQVFQDPEVRALGSKYGDPELLFRYEWIPAIPGINVPGDYESFARNPYQWIMDEWQEIQAGTYSYFIEDYSLQQQAGLR